MTELTLGFGTTVTEDGALPNPDETVRDGLVAGPVELPAVRIRMLAITAGELGRALIALADIRRSLGRLDLAEGIEPAGDTSWLTALGHGLRQMAGRVDPPAAADEAADS